MIVLVKFFSVIIKRYAMVFYSTRRAVSLGIGKHLCGKKIFALNTASEVLTIIGNLLTNFAILLAPVTLVYLVSSFQPAIVLFLTIFATKFPPNIVKENLRERILLPKIIAIAIMIVGSVILFL